MIGTEIGPYRLIEKIGQGGMGIVYKGIHTKLEQEVAIKVLTPALSQDEGMRERFIREAKIQARLSHPNVVNVLNYLESDENLFLIMEYLQGETLETRLKRMGRLPEAVAVCINILSALEFMHSRGIVHRDIKPANVMFLADGTVKVMDFGIAKLLGEKGQTRTGVRLGTLWYMAPEQIRGEEATALADIYAVGVTLYQMMTGEIPFDGNSDYEIMKANLEQEPIPPWEVNQNVSEEFGRIILKAMSKNKGDRYQSAKEFADDLKSAAVRASGEKVAPAGVIRPLAAPAAVMGASPHLGGAVSSILHTFPRVSRKAVIVALLLFALLLIILMAQTLFFRHKEEAVFPAAKEVPVAPLPAPVVPVQGNPQQERSAVVEPTVEPVKEENGFPVVEPAVEPVKEKHVSPVPSPKGEKRRQVSRQEHHPAPGKRRPGKEVSSADKAAQKSTSRTSKPIAKEAAKPTAKPIAKQAANRHRKTPKKKPAQRPVQEQYQPSTVDADAAGSGVWKIKK